MYTIEIADDLNDYPGNLYFVHLKTIPLSAELSQDLVKLT